MSDSMKEVIETVDPVTRRILPSDINLGTLVPLKTVLELRDNLTLGYAYITRAPNRVTNDVVNIARSLIGDDVAKNLPHLRRCAKPGDLAPHLKTQFMHEGNGRQVHASKSNWLYILLGRKDELQYDELVRSLSTVDDIRDDIFVGLIPVPLLAPTSQIQANLWSQQFWQTVYRKNNPLGPHPATVTRTESTVSRDASIWLTLAHQVAKKAQKEGIGEPIGAVIEKDKETTQIVAIAGDARWHQQEKIGHTGNPMAHAALRAISMVAQKLVRPHVRPGNGKKIMEFESFQDEPLLDDEQVVFEAEHPVPDGYLCHELELYMTHEPCTMCAMAILHSRMGRIVFRHRMPLTGGMSAEDRDHNACRASGTCERGQCGGGQGLGLHWRKELNWTLLGWEWETDQVEGLPVNPHLHA
ncbi:hypothetical protein M434DRAFT_67154 [Hypoxylon sp. CO27-5]|nr:hypothetical protein M434DRAFT_67154 [Hypoxylon sp. CO27-5]